MRERVQKILSGRGVASRRRAEEMIQQGRVTCNGQLCSLGDTADPDVDDICVDGKRIPAPTNMVYIMLNKPRGYVTTASDEKGRRNVCELVDCGIRVYPIGRLDMDSEGLLLFTNDGEFANKLMHPSNEVNKTYRVTVSGFSNEKVKQLDEPMMLDGYLLKKPEVRCIGNADSNRAVLEITIHEGRNRQVRRMCALAGMKVTRLIRISEGSLKLGKLAVGKWRYLTQQEICALNE